MPLVQPETGFSIAAVIVKNQGADGFRQGNAVVLFHHHQTAGCQDVCWFYHCQCPVGQIFLVGRVHEHQVKAFNGLLHPGRQQMQGSGFGQIQLEKGCAGMGKTGTEIGFDQTACLQGPVDKEGEHRPPAQGLGADGAGAGKEIKNPGSLDPRAEDVEQSLANPVAGRSDTVGSGGEEFAPPGAAAGDAHNGQPKMGDGSAELQR